MTAINVMLNDKVTATAVRRTADGYLVAMVPVARTGIQTYLGSELGLNDRATVNVWRPPEVVFAKDAMASYAHKPITNDHPHEFVTADNWKQFAVGQIGGEVVRDGEMVSVPLVLMDRAAINDYDNGKRELSMGYISAIEIGDGVTPEGEAYGAKVVQMGMNHLALVDRARGGSNLRIGDGHTPDSVNRVQPTGGVMPTKIILVDGLQVETTDAGAAAIEKLQGQLRDLGATHSAKLADHSKALADKDGELARKDAEITDLKGKVLTDAQIDAVAAKRAELLTTAKALHDTDYTGKTVPEIHKAVCVAKLGDAAVAGKSPEYIAMRFDILAEDAAKAAPQHRQPDPVANVLQQTNNVRQIDAADPTGQLAREQRLRDGWKAGKQA